ncbi:MAG: hypothetical protein BAJATHORv1_10051 [Candidatus Thorarchaeota archaeon]|nr:MAG: hypothetical protein BAJATHORv1_10051 [Candidatus Thorarchaeota archaeon]
MSRKKWGRSTTKTEKVIREAIPKKEVLKEIDDYLVKASSVTPYDLANKFNIRMSVARKILREKEEEGIIVPYIRESGFVVYTTPSEMEKREKGKPIMISDVLEEVASSVPSEPIATEEMEAALAAAAAPTSVKPSKLKRKRREAGAKKERKDSRPEVVVEPLEEEEEEEKEPKSEKPKEAPKKKPKKEEPKKAPKKEEPKKEEPKKAPKKAEPKKEEPKKEVKKPAKKKPKPKLSDISGIGPAMEEKLREAGIKTVLNLSREDPEKLSDKVDGVGLATAKKYIAAAKKALE